MPLDRLVLIIVVVFLAVAGTIWLGAIIAAALNLPQVGWMVAVPVALVLYVGWRVISERLRNAEDDHYDRIEK